MIPKHRARAVIFRLPAVFVQVVSYGIGRARNERDMCATASPVALRRGAALDPDAWREVVAAADSHDRSWSFPLERGGTVERRTLAFFDGDSGPPGLLARAAAAMGMPPAAIAAWDRARDGADAVGLAVGETSVRLYVQHWAAMAERRADGETGPLPLYAGIKALGDGSARADIYLCHPAAPPSTFLPPAARLLDDLGLPAVAATLAPLSAQNAIWCEIDGAARRSWLLTVRRAPIDRADVAAAFAAPPRPGSFGAQPDVGVALAEIHREAQSHDLLHLAGGEDPVKGRFGTIYFETDAAGALEAVGL